MTNRDKFRNNLFGYPLLKQKLERDFNKIIKYLDFVYEGIEIEQKEIDKISDGFIEFEDKFAEEQYNSYISDKSFDFDSVFPEELNKGIFLSIFGTFEFRLRTAHKLIYQIVKQKPYSNNKFVDIWSVKKNILDLLECTNELLNESWTNINNLKEIRNSIVHNNSIINVELKNSNFNNLKELIINEYSVYLIIDNGFFKIRNKGFHYYSIEKFKIFFNYLDLEVKEYISKLT